MTVYREEQASEESKWSALEETGQISHLMLRNFLSFGDEIRAVNLRRLNIFVGANGSGKSNIVQALALLNSLVHDLDGYSKSLGPIEHLVNKSTRNSVFMLGFCAPLKTGEEVRYFAGFSASLQGLNFNSEFIEEVNSKENDAESVNSIERLGEDIVYRSNLLGEPQTRESKTKFDSNILKFYGDIFGNNDYVSHAFSLVESISVHKPSELAINANSRAPVPIRSKAEHLEPDGRNLPLVLNHLFGSAETRRKLEHQLDQLFSGGAKFHFQPLGDYASFGLIIDDLNIPASRLSDGTLRWLYLLAILLDPKPPSMIVIEEPEIGLHPDMMGALAELLRDAALKTQVVVTTHSPELVDQFTDTPEVVAVCDRVDGETRVRRFGREQLSAWLADDYLGSIWKSGRIGGNRW